MNCSGDARNIACADGRSKGGHKGLKGRYRAFTRIGSTSTPKETACLADAAPRKAAQSDGEIDPNAGQQRNPAIFAPQHTAERRE